MPSRSTMLRAFLTVSAVSFALVLIYKGQLSSVDLVPKSPLKLVPLPSGHTCSHPELPSRQGMHYCNDPRRGVSGTLCPINNCEADCKVDPFCRAERSRYRLLDATSTSAGLVHVRVAGPLRLSLVTGKLSCSDELFGVLRGPAILPLDFTISSSVVAGTECHYTAAAQLLVGGKYFLSVSVERLADSASLEPDVSLPNRSRVCWKVARNPTRVASLDMFWPLNATAVYLGAEVLPRLSRLDVVELPNSIDCGRLVGAQSQWVHYSVMERAVRECKLAIGDYDYSDNYIWFNPRAKPFLDGKPVHKWLKQVMRKKKILFVGDSTVEDIWRFWTQAGPWDELLKSAKVRVEYESVWGTYEFMYSSEENPFMCDVRTMGAGGWRSVDAVAKRVAKVKPTVVVIGENLHTLKKVSLAYYGKLLKKLFAAVRGACAQCVILFKPTSQPVGRRCACPKDIRVSWCAFDIFYGRKRLRNANAIAGEVGREFDIISVEDAYEMTLARQELSRDGIHWSKSFFACRRDPFEPCSSRSCQDYAAGNWQPVPGGFAVTNRTASTNPIVSQRKNFFRDLYPDSPLAITSGIILDTIISELHKRANSDPTPLSSTLMAVAIQNPTFTRPSNHRDNEETLRAPVWLQAYGHSSNFEAPSSTSGVEPQLNNHYYGMHDSQEDSLLGVNMQSRTMASANSSQVAQDFISIINDTAIDEGEPPTAEDDMTASQATAMIEEVLASGGESTGTVEDMVQSSDTMAGSLGRTEGSQMAASAWTPLLNVEQSYCKILITHKQAGAIIGKNGAEIAALEKSAQITAKVSPATNFFPGTTDRIMVMSGKPTNIRTALQELVDRFEFCIQLNQVQEDAKKTFFDGTNVTSRYRPLATVLRLVVPNSSVGTLMGRQGRDIRQLAMTCGVHIQISPRINGVLERIVNVTGSASQCALAGCAITEGIRRNPHVAEHANILIYTPYQHRQAAKQAELSNANRGNDGGSPVDPRTSHFSSASDVDVTRGLPAPPTLPTDFDQYTALLSLISKSNSTGGSARGADPGCLPPDIAFQEELRRQLRSTIQNNLVKEARRRAVDLERELGPSILGLGPRPEYNLIVQAMNAGMAAASVASFEAVLASTKTASASATMDLYKRLLAEERIAAEQEFIQSGDVPPAPPPSLTPSVEMMMGTDTAVAVTMAVPGVTSANVGGSSSSSSLNYHSGNTSPDYLTNVHHANGRVGRGEGGETGGSTCSYPFYMPSPVLESEEEEDEECDVNKYNND